MLRIIPAVGVETNFIESINNQGEIKLISKNGTYFS